MQPQWQQQQEMMRRQQEHLRQEQERLRELDRQQQKQLRQQQEQMQRQQEQQRRNMMGAWWVQEQEKKRQQQLRQRQNIVFPAQSGSRRFPASPVFGLQPRVTDASPGWTSPPADISHQSHPVAGILTFLVTVVIGFFVGLYVGSIFGPTSVFITWGVALILAWQFARRLWRG